MTDALGRDIKPGDFVIPYVAHKSRIHTKSLFGIVTSDNTVFCYDDYIMSYKIKEATHCLKIEDYEFKGLMLGEKNRLMSEYKKYTQESLIKSSKQVSPNKLKLGQCFSINREYSTEYYVYLGEDVKFSFFEYGGKEFRTDFTEKRVYLYFSDEHISQRATNFFELIKMKKELSLAELLFSSKLNSDIKLPVYGRLNLEHMIELRGRAIQGLTYICDITILDFKDSKTTLLDMRKSKIGYEAGVYYRYGIKVGSLTDFVMTCTLK